MPERDTLAIAADPTRAAAPARMLAAGPKAVAEAVACLVRGGLVALPTETVYGLGADATQGEAVARLYRAKGRPSFNPLIAHVPDLTAAEKIARFDARSGKLAEAFWPGPLTLVLPQTPDCVVADLATAGLSTIAVRVPNHPVAQAVLRGLGRPVVAPSANRSGRVSPTSAVHVFEDLGDRIDLVLDGGDCAVGLESTIVACLDRAVLLRPGGIVTSDIERVLGEKLAPMENHAPDQPLAPGLLASHYAPRANLRLGARDVKPGEALLAFGAADLPGRDNAVAMLNLSPSGDLIEAAARVFGYLRKLDQSNAATIAVMEVPDRDLGEAINDRLRRAAAPRDVQ